MAATIIDELIVTLGLDASKFSKGQQDALDSLRKLKDESEKSGKQVEKSSDAMSEAIGGVTRKALELTSVFLTGLGIKNFLEGVVRANTQLGRTADVLGQSVSEVGKLSTGTYLAGGSIGGMTSTLKALNDQIALVKMGAGAGTGLTQTLSALKISLVDSGGQIKTNTTLLREMTARIHELNVEPSVAVSLLERAGISGDVIPQMLHGVDVFDRFNEQADRLRKRNPEDVAAAGQLTTAWRAMTTALEGLGDKIITFVANPLSKVLDLITNIIRVIGQNSTGLVGAVIGGIFGGVAGFLSPIPGGAIAGAVGGAMAGGYLSGRIGGSPNYLRSGPENYSTGKPGEAGSINAVPGASGNAGGNAAVAAMRASRMAEINANPQLKEEVASMLALEEGKGNGRTAAMESLLNRSIMVGNTIQQELHSGFYSTVNDGRSRRPIGGANRAASQDAMDAAAAGSNLNQGRTDQGMAGDPNANGPGRVRVPGTSGIFNFWKGHRGGRDYTWADSERFANSLNKIAEGSAFEGQQPAVPFMQSPAFAPGQPGVTNNQSSTDNSRKSSAEINVKELNVAPPPAADPYAWAKELVPAIKRAAEVTNWDTGPY